MAMEPNEGSACEWDSFSMDFSPRLLHVHCSNRGSRDIVYFFNNCNTVFYSPTEESAFKIQRVKFCKFSRRLYRVHGTTFHSACEKFNVVLHF